MKTKSRMSNAQCRTEKRGRRDFVIRHSTFDIRAFTLIELLTVMAIIAALAAFLFPVVGRIKRQQYIKNATAEMEQLETALDRYKAAYGFYPPDNPCNPLVNQLYFELLGTTNLAVPPAAPFYQSLDDPTVQLKQSDFANAFGTMAGNNCVSGFMNCSKPGSSEDTPKAQNFLPNLRPNQTTLYSNNLVGLKLIITSVKGPDVTYKPLGLGAPDINPWRYNSSSPTNNPGAYDLWVQLVISGKTNLICNWNKQVQLNSPLP
ncbi:MAG TPA: prepilin-type N-terminal cleavage/methylation domain-containing protein [Verrucomicrobiae bacterium]|nr:prepilin-type N-terminal cleavage/methylation domain-containing protein [Verrucomicrobiae bacterium]